MSPKPTSAKLLIGIKRTGALKSPENSHWRSATPWIKSRYFQEGVLFFRGGARRIVLRGFRHWLYYTEADGHVQVIAIYHTRTDPGTYSARVQ